MCVYRIDTANDVAYLYVYSRDYLHAERVNIRMGRIIRSFRLREARVRTSKSTPGSDLHFEVDAFQY